MNANFLSNYDFDRNVSYISKVELESGDYPSINNTKEFNCKDYRHEHYDFEIPMLSPIFSNNLVNIDEFLNGGEVKLKGNYTPETPIILSNTTTKVELNNKTITGPIFAESNGEVNEGTTDSYVFWVKEGAELTINGNGKIIAQEAKYSMAVWANGGKVIINGGKFYNNGNNSDLIYASNNGVVEIYGGEFHANKNEGASGTKNVYPALNIKDKDRNNSSITVYGGKFYGFDPSNYVSEGENTNFVAEGYKSVEIEEGVFEVMPE